MSWFPIRLPTAASDKSSAPSAQMTLFVAPASTARWAKASSALQMVPRAARPQRWTPGWLEMAEMAWNSWNIFRQSTSFVKVHPKKTNMIYRWLYFLKEACFPVVQLAEGNPVEWFSNVLLKQLFLTPNSGDVSCRFPKISRTDTFVWGFPLSKYRRQRQLGSSSQMWFNFF